MYIIQGHDTHSTGPHRCSLASLSVPPQTRDRLAAIDPQRVQDQETMTWKDYRPIPGATWNDATRKGERISCRLVAVDFEDQPFVITLPKGSDLFGNPQVEPVKREAVAKFYAEFWGKPGALNYGHTIHEYWMEQSAGGSIPPSRPSVLPMPKKLFHAEQARPGCRLPHWHTCNHAWNLTWMQCGLPKPAPTSRRTTTSCCAFTPATTRRASGRSSGR